MPETATVQITMPEMGESVTEGIVLEWHVAEGDAVKEGDTVVEVSTDKVDAEVPAPMDGVITKIVAQVDDEVPVGAPLAEMEAGDGEGQSARPAGPVDAGDPPPAAEQQGVPPTTPPTGRAVEEVLVLDFGGQYSQLIARRIRECGVFAELLPASTSVEKINERKPKGLVLSGGPASVYEPGAPKFPTQLLDLEIPMLGICYGMQAMVLALGGRVE